MNAVERNTEMLMHGIGMINTVMPLIRSSEDHISFFQREQGVIHQEGNISAYIDVDFIIGMDMRVGAFKGAKLRIVVPVPGDREVFQTGHVDNGFDH